MPTPTSSRRNVVRSGVWAVPVVATVVAVPAYAASPRCVSQTVDWGRPTPGTKVSSITSTSSDPTVRTTVTVSTTGSQGSSANLTTSRGAQGNTAPNLLLQFERTNPASTPSQTVTFEFSPPVTNLRFTILDIDSSNNTGANAGDGRYYDAVSLSGNISALKPATVVGDGSNGSPFQNASNNTRVGATSTDGNVAVSYGNNAIDSIRLTYRSTVPLTSGQMQVALSNFTFQQAGC